MYERKKERTKNANIKVSEMLDEQSSFTRSLENGILKATGFHIYYQRYFAFSISLKPTARASNKRVIAKMKTMKYQRKKSSFVECAREKELTLVWLLLRF